ncbi:MAG TPA: GMC family oxidoreductase, partial [Actinobacteria bacterium]|nr:GMC family oxidoreductase [Actinomycetota bacterium]
CMIGCRHGAKNRLDKNYLHLAERLGVEILPEHEVVAVRPHAGGYLVEARVPGRRRRRPPVTAEQVVIAAGTRGTLELLLRMRAAGHLDGLSPRLGENLRTNSEAVVGATARSDRVDYSEGVAITSSIHPDARTHIEPVRYPRGSNAMGLLATILVDGDGSTPRWRRFVAAVAERPGAFLRSLSVRHWARRTVILLVMQAHDNALRGRLRRGRLVAELDDDRPNPSYLPVANEAARIAAELVDGDPTSSLNEVLLDAPITAHLIGGVCIGEGPDTGVVDAYHRVFGHPGLHVVDGSVIGANLGANPSLTITALAERALAAWPNRGEPDRRPPLGAPYGGLEPVPPRRPAVPADAVGALFYAS